MGKPQENHRKMNVYPLVNIHNYGKIHHFSWQTASHNQMVSTMFYIQTCGFCVTWYTLYHPYLLFLLPPWPGMGNRVVCGAPQPLGSQNGLTLCQAMQRMFKKQGVICDISEIIIDIKRERYIYIFYRYIFRDFEWLWMKHFDPQPYHLHHYSMICCTKPVIGDIYIYTYVYNNSRSSTNPTQYANMEHITLQILHCQYD